MSSSAVRLQQLRQLHAGLDACRKCPKMIGPVVHGPALLSPVLLIGQAPGPREGKFGRPFAWTAGRTMFRWFEEALGHGEETMRQRIFISAVARCFPGKAKGGGDRRPDEDEIAACGPWLQGEVALLRPKLVLPVGTMAIAQVLGHTGPLKQVVGQALRRSWLGAEVDVICLPHPSGASTWHRMEPGITLLKKALRLVKRHPAVAEAFG